MSIYSPDARPRRIAKAQYHNLLPTMREHLLCRRFADGDEHTFIGTDADFEDAMRRCAYLD